MNRLSDLNESCYLEGPCVSELLSVPPGSDDIGGVGGGNQNSWKTLRGERS